MDREAQKFWRQRRKEMLRHSPPRPGRWTQGSPVTAVLIAAMVLGTLVEMFAPGLLGMISALPGGFWIYLVVSVLLPGGFLGLIFSGLFVWMIGTTIESVASTGQYLVIFFGSGIVGAFIIHFLGGGGATLAAFGLGGGGATLAAFGLAGAYVYGMSHIDQRGAARWGLLLLVINVALSGFQPALIAGEASAFVTGLGIAYGMQLGG